MALNLRENQPFEGIFLLKQITEARTKNGSPYLAMLLGSPEMDLEGRMWDTALDSLGGLASGDPVRVRGTAVLYQERLQAKVDSLVREKDPVDPRLLYPSTTIPEGELRRELALRASSLKDPDLEALFRVVQADRPFMEAFLVSPAAVVMHHARIGGLAEHSLGVCRLAESVAAIWPMLDRDLLMAGSLLHDIGKVREYSMGNAFQVTLEGRLVGHITAGVTMLEAWCSRIAGFPERLRMELAHIIISHHGQLEHGSPKTPATPEALVIHFADDLDAKLDMLAVSAGAAVGEEGSREAFVRGLRRSFIFRGERTAEPERAGTAASPSAARRSSLPKEEDDQGKLF